MKPQRYGPFKYTPINRRPKIIWPDGNHVALWIVPNIETFPLNEPIPGGTGVVPDVITCNLGQHNMVPDVIISSTM